LIGLLVATSPLVSEFCSLLQCFYALLIGLLVATRQPVRSSASPPARFYALLIGLLVATEPVDAYGTVLTVSMPS